MNLRSLIKNTTFVLVAKIINSIFSLITFILIARAITISELGIYALIVSVSSVISVIANCGTSEHLFRRGSSNVKLIPHMLNSTYITRIFLGILIGLIVTIYTVYLRQDPLFWILFPLGIIAVLIDAQTVAYIMAFRSQGNMTFEAHLYTWRGLLKLTLIAFVISQLQPNLEYLFATLVVVNSCGLLFAIYFNRRIFIKKMPSARKRYIYPFVKSSTPYLWMGILGIIYAQSDILMLGMYSKDTEIGIYSVAFQVFQTLAFVPTSFNIAIQPILVRLFKSDRKLWSQQTQKLIFYLILPAAIISVSLAIFLPKILPLVFGSKYNSATPVMTILLYAFGFRIVWISSITTTFISGGKIKVLNRLVFIALILHLVLNLILISKWGAMGAAYSTLATELFLVITAALLLYKNHKLFS